MRISPPRHRYRPPARNNPFRRGRTAVAAVTATVAALGTSAVAGASATPRTPATISTATTATATATATAFGTGSSRPGTKATARVTSGGRIYFGVDGTVSTAANGISLARHVYGQVGGNVPNARMVTMGTSGMSYTKISGAQPGSSTYDNIVRWARTIKVRGTLTFFGFHHEPEAKDQARFGTASQYIAAYRHVADIIRGQHVGNIRFVWQVTAFAFRRTDSQAAAHYYPGDGYVDEVGADPYNWGDCRGGSGKWTQLGPVTDPVLAFARAHGKHVILAEFASDAGSARAGWLASAHRYLIANRNVIQGAFYFDHDLIGAAGSRCDFALRTGPDIAAFRAIVNDRAIFSS